MPIIRIDKGEDVGAPVEDGFTSGFAVEGGLKFSPSAKEKKGVFITDSVLARMGYKRIMEGDEEYDKEYSPPYHTLPDGMVKHKSEL